MIGPERYSFRALWRQYRNCRRNKRNTFNALVFEVDAEIKLLRVDLRPRFLRLRRGNTPLIVAGGTRVLGVIALKGGMKERFAELWRMGIKTVMITAI